MSDVMLFGVLRMPYELAMGDDVSRLQFYNRAQEAADRIERLEAANARLRAAAQPSQQVPVEMTPIDALRNLVNAIGGGKKACGHQFDCSCAFNDARALLAQSAPAAIDVRPVAWFTDDHLTDKSATTYDSAVRDRWIAKGWAVHPLYATSTAIDAQDADDTPYPFLPSGFLIDKVGDSYVARHPATASESQPYPTRQAATACAWADYASQLDRAIQSPPQTSETKPKNIGKEVAS